MSTRDYQPRTPTERAADLVLAARWFDSETDAAPCGRCEKPVSLDHDPPCPEGLVACPECGHAAVCDDCRRADLLDSAVLTVHHDIEQGTADWADIRRGVLTASVIGRLITPTLKVANNDTSRGITASLVAERITGVTEISHMNDDMFRGVLCEPIARDIYSGHYQQAVECGFMQLDGDGFSIGMSPDGLVADQGGVEIKCPRAKGHIATILADKVPDAYMAQIQTALLVSGRDWWDYVSFHGGLPLYVKRVYPDPAWHAAILAAAIAFEQNAEQMVAAYRKATAGLPATQRIDHDLEMVI